MSRDALKTLFHPFEAGMLEAPSASASVLFLGAEAGFRLPAGFEADIRCVQGFRPLYNALVAARCNVEPQAAGDDYDCALVLCGKHRGENEARVADALRRTRPGSLIVVAGGKEDGIQAMRKRLLQLELECDHMPKYHGQALWFVRPQKAEHLVAGLDTGSQDVEGRFLTVPGMFSHAGVDAGSELLAARLPADFNGTAADFGAGWGYLSVMLADKAPKLKSVDLYEADFAALECARQNLARNCPDTQARFFWHDMAAEPIAPKYDLVIMNPPFHEGHLTTPGLGQTFIRRAAEALKGGGELLMVANRGLPYEQTLSTLFKSNGETCRNARFKVLWARK